MKDLRKAAFGYASKRGYGHLSEDYAQFVCEQALKERFTHFKYHLVDFLRTQKWIRRETELLVDVESEEYWSPEENVIGEVKALLKGEERAMVLLILEWGFNQREISNLWGVTDSRVSHALNNVREKIMKGKGF